MANQILTDPARHQKAEGLEVEVIADWPAPAVGNHKLADPFWMSACEVEADWPTPVVHEERDVTKIEMVKQGFETVRVTFGMMIFALGTAR